MIRSQFKPVGASNLKPVIPPSSTRWHHITTMTKHVATRQMTCWLFLFLRRWSQWTSCSRVWTRPKTESYGWKIIKVGRSDRWTWKSELRSEENHVQALTPFWNLYCLIFPWLLTEWEMIGQPNPAQVEGDGLWGVNLNYEWWCHTATGFCLCSLASRWGQGLAIPGQESGKIRGLPVNISHL